MKLIILIFVSGSSSSAEQDVSDKINVSQEFKSLDMDIKSARADQVDVLAPRNFNVATNYLEDAKKSLDKDEELKKEILGEINLSRAYLDHARQAARLSHKNMEDVLIARREAVDAGAPVYFAYEFRTADEQLQNVTADLEYNSIQSVLKNHDNLLSTYSDLELRAIKHQYLAESRLKLIQALKDGAKKYAPQKLDEALKKYRETYAYINGHRHDTDQIQTRSFEVKNSADELLDTTHTLATAQKRPQSESTAFTELAELENNQKIFEDKISAQQSAVASEQKTIQTLQAKINALEAEKSRKNKFEEIRRKFTKNEADVYKQGRNIVIRLRGIEFPVSHANLKNSKLPVMNKVRQVMQEFNDGSILVEGRLDINL